MYWHTFLICIWMQQESRFIKRSNKLARTCGTRHDVNGRANHFQILPHLWCQRNTNLCFPRFLRVYLTRCSEIQQLLCCFTCFTCFTSWRFEVQTLWGRPIPSGTPSWSRCLVFCLVLAKKNRQRAKPMGKTMSYTIPNFTIFLGCMVAIPSHGWFMKLFFPHDLIFFRSKMSSPGENRCLGPLARAPKGASQVMTLGNTPVRWSGYIS